MSELPASHYAKIYRVRIRSAEKGVTRPSAKILKQSRSLLAGLEKIDPKKMITLEQASGKMLFKESESGAIVGCLDYDP